MFLWHTTTERTKNRLHGGGGSHNRGGTGSLHHCFHCTAAATVAEQKYCEKEREEHGSPRTLGLPNFVLRLNKRIELLLVVSHDVTKGCNPLGSSVVRYTIAKRIPMYWIQDLALKRSCSR